MQFSPHTGLLWQFIWPLKNRGDFWRSFFLEEIMESADSLATFQYEVAKNEFIKFCKSKDFENLSVKEKKEVLVERINSSYFIKNLYNLFALSYERLLKKNDSAFSNLDTLMSVFAEEFKNIQTEEFEKRISKIKCEKITAIELEKKAKLYADEHYADKDENGDWLSDEQMLSRAFIAGAKETQENEQLKQKDEELKRKNDILEIQLNMNIRLIQITKEVFESLSRKESTYFVNGVIFDEATDNVVAFENLENGKTFTYWKVEK